MKKITLLFSMFCLGSFLNAQNTWVQKTNFGGVARFVGFGFSIGTKGYIGAGKDGTTLAFSDMWEWDQSSNSWTQKASLNLGRQAPMSFSINGKGYVCMGFNGGQLNDLWEYDPSTNNWTAKANFPGAGRYGAAGFSIGNKGYIGLGCPAGGNGPYSTDFWEYDPSTNAWTVKASPPMTARYSCVGFSVGTMGYMGMGYDGQTTTSFNDLWQYDQTTNTWLQKTSLPGFTRNYSVAFAFAGKGYIGTGQSQATPHNDFWEYNATTDVWVQRANYGGGATWGAVGFAIGAKGYIGTGFNFSQYNNQFWEYTPINVGIDEQGNELNICSVFPTIISDQGTLVIDTTDPLMDAKMNIFDVNGKLVRSFDVTDHRFSFAKGSLDQGMYFFEVNNKNIKIGSGKFQIL